MAREALIRIVRLTPIVVALLGTVVASAAPNPDRQKTVWNYDGGIPFQTEGSLAGGPCFRLNGHVNAAVFFDGLKRIDNANGTTFLRGREAVWHFPKELSLAFVIYDFACPAPLKVTGAKEYLTREMMSTVNLFLYWKRGVELRRIERFAVKDISVEPLLPYAKELASTLPERFTWKYQLEVPSEGVPLTESLVLVLRTPDGRIAARVAARL